MDFLHKLLGILPNHQQGIGMQNMGQGLAARAAQQGMHPQLGAGMLPSSMSGLNMRVQQGAGMQPFGMGQEDDYTPSMGAQPVSFNSGQVSLSGLGQQGSFMGRRPTLRR